jgi:hypothetical protein
MATEQVQLRRGTAAQIAAFTGAAGELVADTTNNRLSLHDGVTAGGYTFMQAGLLYTVVRGINFNAPNTDTIIPLVLPNGLLRFVVNAAYILDATGALTTATAGIFTNTAGGGVAIASTQALTVSTAADATNNNTQAMTLNNSNSMNYLLSGLPVSPNVYFRVVNPQGVAASANVLLHYRPLP